VKFVVRGEVRLLGTLRDSGKSALEMKHLSTGAFLRDSGVGVLTGDTEGYVKNVLEKGIFIYRGSFLKPWRGIIY
jgi:hypothetical protein